MDKPYQKGIMVWAGLFKDQLIGPYFFTRGTVTGEKYLYMLKEIVWPLFEVVFDKDRCLSHALSPRWCTRALPKRGERLAE